MDKEANRMPWSLPVREPAKSEADHDLWRALWSRDAQGMVDAIEAGANAWASSVGVCGKERPTPLMSAASMRWVDGIRALAPFRGARLRSEQGRDAARWAVDGEGGDVGACLAAIWGMGGMASAAADGSALMAALRRGVGAGGGAAMARADFEALMRRAAPEEAMEDGSDALMSAAALGAPSWAIEALGERCDPRGVDAAGRSAWMRALSASELPAARALASRSDKSAVDQLGRSGWVHAAMGAAASGSVELLDWGMEWSLGPERDWRGVGAFGWAAEVGFDESEGGDAVFERLLAQARFDERGARGGPALMGMMDGWSLSGRQESRVMRAAGLLDANAQDASGRDALMFAALKGWENIVRLLFSMGLGAARDRDGRTALMWAARSGRDRVCGILSGRDAAQMVDKDGASALMHAVSHKRWGAARVLLEHSDPSRRDKDGESPLSRALADPSPEADGLAGAMTAQVERGGLIVALGGEELRKGWAKGTPRV